MAVALLDDSGVIQTVDPDMPCTAYSVNQAADTVGCAVVLLLAIHTPGHEVLDVGTLTFSFNGVAPDATAFIGGQQGDLPIGLAYAYWLIAADVAPVGDVVFDITSLGAISKTYRAYVTAFSGVSSVSGVELASGIDQEVPVAFAAPGDLPTGSAALLMAVCSPDATGVVPLYQKLAPTEVIGTGLVGQSSFISFFEEAENASAELGFTLDTSA